MKWKILFLLLSATLYSQNKNLIFNPKDSITHEAKKTNSKTSTNDPIQSISSYPLASELKETSGLVYFDSLFWTHNDDQDTTLYGMDAQGKIQKKIALNGVINRDWEAIEQDEMHLYIGDFGNNSSGNSNKLKILKIAKKTLFSTQPQIDTLHFQYEDQTDFNPQKPNRTAFDCEAFIVTPDFLYLFTKNWYKSICKVYVVPNRSGTHSAKEIYSFESRGLITDACYLPQQQTLFLCGYSKLLRPYILRFNSFDPQNFNSATIEEIRLPLLFHQIEAITSLDGTTLYLTNEALIKPPLVNTPAQFHEIVWKN